MKIKFNPVSVRGWPGLPGGDDFYAGFVDSFFDQIILNAASTADGSPQDLARGRGRYLLVGFGAIIGQTMQAQAQRWLVL